MGWLSGQCDTCRGSGECQECDGSGQNARGEDHMIHMLGDVDIPCPTCSESGECQDCDGTGQYEYESDDEEESDD